MAYINLRLHSEIMHHAVEVDIFSSSDFTQGSVPEIRAVFTLLHGYGGTSKDWIQLSSACRYAADNGLILVAPDCGNGFYCDMVYGDKWYTFLTQELPEQLNRIFRLPASREQNFLAGLSMGGYGAMMIGMRNPDRYAGIASFSGAVDVQVMLDAGRDLPEDKNRFIPVFGRELQLAEDLDLHVLLRRVSSLPPEEQPKLLFTCGTEDGAPFYIYQENRTLYEDAHTLPLANYRYMEWTGNHEWKFWDRSLVYAIDWFLSPGYAEAKLGDWRSQASVFT